MARQHDSRGTSRDEDWARLWFEVRRFPDGRILHALANIGVEELRRWGAEPKYDDGSYKAPWLWWS